MNYEIRTIRAFDKELKRLSKHYHSLKNDLKNLIAELEQNPEIGVDLGHGLRKVRMAIASKGRGKSHGARVILHNTLIHVNEGVITLIFLYDKAKCETLNDAEIKTLLKEIDL